MFGITLIWKVSRNAERWPEGGNNNKKKKNKNRSLFIISLYQVSDPDQPGYSFSRQENVHNMNGHFTTEEIPFCRIEDS
jgi:hypothetical protein